jgi:hypothetical protein
MQRRESNGRILNMLDYAAAAQRKPPGTDPAPSGRKLLFHAAGLNKVIFVKHNVRPNEREMFARKIQLATKVFMPFDPNRLESGGRSFFIEEPNYGQFLRDYFQIDPDSADPKVHTDLQILNILQEAPTLDPFVVCERLRAAGIEPDPEIFSSSYTLIRDASERVFEVFRPLLEKAMSKIVSPDEMSRFAGQIWNVTESTTSSPFLEALHIPRSDWVSVIFAWKALIYYDLISQKADERFEEMSLRLRSIRFHGTLNARDIFALQNLQRAFLDSLRRLKDSTSKQIRSALDKLVAAVTGEPDPTAISAALRDMATNVSDIGADVMLFDQVSSYFLYLVPANSTSADPETLTESVTNLSEILATGSRP